MPNLTIVANIVVKEDKVDFVKSELLKLVEKTLAEDGCINYDLHQDNNNPTFFMFYENWESRELWQKHMKSDHLAEYKKITEGAVEKTIIFELTKF